MREGFIINKNLFTPFYREGDVLGLGMMRRICGIIIKNINVIFPNHLNRKMLWYNNDMVYKSSQIELNNNTNNNNTNNNKEMTQKLFQEDIAAHVKDLEETSESIKNIEKEISDTNNRLGIFFRNIKTKSIKQEEITDIFQKEVKNIYNLLAKFHSIKIKDLTFFSLIMAENLRHMEVNLEYSTTNVNDLFRKKKIINHSVDYHQRKLYEIIEKIKTIIIHLNYNEEIRKCIHKIVNEELKEVENYFEETKNLEKKMKDFSQAFKKVDEIVEDFLKENLSINDALYQSLEMFKETAKEYLDIFGQVQLLDKRSNLLPEKIIISEKIINLYRDNTNYFENDKNTTTNLKKIIDDTKKQITILNNRLPIEINTIRTQYKTIEDECMFICDKICSRNIEEDAQFIEAIKFFKSIMKDYNNMFIELNK
jgi:hypothetical protein